MAPVKPREAFAKITKASSSAPPYLDCGKELDPVKKLSRLLFFAAFPLLVLPWLPLLLLFPVLMPPLLVLAPGLLLLVLGVLTGFAPADDKDTAH